ncbi:hypothetical protein ACQWG3_26310, partial [Salmonella enterica subsp. enterica serovar Infantis]
QKFKNIKILGKKIKINRENHYQNILQKIIKTKTPRRGRPGPGAARPVVNKKNKNPHKKKKPIK